MPDLPEVADGELLARAATGDVVAFDQFVVRHRAQVFRYAMGLARHHADAEDVLQQTFVQAWRAAAGARVEGSARPWLFAIARHALQRSRRRPAEVAGDPVSLDALGGDAGFADPTATPQRFAMAMEERDVLAAALQQLAEPDREVLLLREIEELSGEDTARVLGLSLEAMKSRLHRARLRLVAEVRRRLPEGGLP